MMELIDETGGVFPVSFSPVPGGLLHGTGTRDKTEKGKLAHLAIDVLTWTLNDYGMLMFFFDALCPFLSTDVVDLDFDL